MRRDASANASACALTRTLSVDFLAVQTTLAGQKLSWWGHVRVHGKFCRRLAADE